MQSSLTGIYQVTSQELKREGRGNDEVFGGKVPEMQRQKTYTQKITYCYQAVVLISHSLKKQCITMYFIKEGSYRKQK